GRVADHVLGVGRAFQPMHQNEREALRPDLLRLPMAMAKHIAGPIAEDRAFHFDQKTLRLRQRQFARKKISGERLQVSIAEQGARQKGREPILGRRAHAARRPSRTNAARCAPSGVSSCLKYAKTSPWAVRACSFERIASRSCPE